MKSHFYTKNGEQILEIENILAEDARYFEDNGIKVSLEELGGEIIVYGCPYTD